MLQQINTTQNGLNVQKLIESNVYESEGHKMIKIPHYGLDFEGEFVFLGFTKSGRVRLGEVYSSGPQGIKWTVRIGTFDGKNLTVCADNFLKSIAELERDAN